MQVNHKITLYSCQQNVINEAIGIDVNHREEEIKSLDELRNQLMKKAKSDKDETETDIQEDIENINIQMKNIREEITVQGNGGIIGKAFENNHNLKIKRNEINKILPESEEISLYEDEMEEIKANGFIGPFEIQEKKPIPWKNVLSLAVIGLVQMVAGAAFILFTCGLGATIGSAFLSEGISDLITAVQDGIINRDFNWKSWGIQKAISLTVSVICAGVSAVKDVLKTTIGAVKTIGTKMTTVVKSGWKLAARCLGKTMAKDTAKKLANILVEYGIDKILIKKIEELIESEVEVKIQNVLLNNENVKLMLELDSKNRNNYYQEKIRNIGYQILNRNSVELEDIVRGIAKSIIQTVDCKLVNAENQEEILVGACKVASGVIKNKSRAVRYVDIARILITATLDIRNFLPTFLDSITDDINKFAADNNIKEVENKYIANANSSAETHSFINTSEAQTDIDLTKLKINEKQATQEDMSVDSDKITRAISKEVSLKIAEKIKSGFVTPAVSKGVSFAMDKLTARVDDCMERHLEDYKSMRRIEFIQDGDRDNRVPKKYKKGLDNQNFLNKANEMIAEVRNGGEIGLPHLGALSDACDFPIAIFDENGNCERIIGTDKTNPPIKVQHHPASGGNPGHFTKINGVEATQTSTGANDCIFNVISDYTVLTPRELRAKTAQNMELRIHDYANQAQDVMRLERSNKAFLQYGGSSKNAYDIEHARKIADGSNGVKGGKFKKKGHAYAHIEPPAPEDAIQIANHKNKVTDKIDKIQNVQTFSKGDIKTAFESKPQLITIFSLVLKESEKVRNELVDDVKVTYSMKELNVRKYNYHLTQKGLDPISKQCSIWYDGKNVVDEPKGFVVNSSSNNIERYDIDSVTLVFQVPKDNNLPVHLHTMYPVPKKPYFDLKDTLFDEVRFVNPFIGEKI